LTIPLLIVPTLWDGVNQVQAKDFAPVVTASQSVLEGVQRWLQGLPIVGSQLSGMFQPLDDFLRSVEEGRVSQWLAPTPTSEGVELAAASLGAVSGVVSPVVRWLLTAAFTILISLYLTTGRYSLRRFILTNAPPASQAELTTLFERIAWTWNSFLLGQLKLMFFIGFVVFLGNLLLGNRYAPLLGLISGVFELIPNLGAILGLIPGVLVALIFGSSWMGVNNAVFAIIILIMYVVIQLFENQIIVPRVLGDAVELPPLVVLIGVLVGGTQAGILGALIAVPVIGTAREVISYVYGKIIESPALEAPPPIETGLVGRLTSSAQSLAARLFGPAGPRRS
jgi:predicted PurR-regulated permease PerM